MTLKQYKRFVTIAAIFATAIITALAVFFGLDTPPTAYAAEDPKYLAVDKLYFDLPKHDETYKFTTCGGTVNGGWNRDTIDPQSAEIAVNNWYDIYIIRDGGWYIPSTQPYKNGKYYLDGTVRMSGSYDIYMEIHDFAQSERMYTFIENGDKLYSRNGDGDPYLTTPITAYNALTVQYVTADNHTLNTRMGDGNPLDPSQWSIDGSTHWTCTGPDDFSSMFGLQPASKSYKLWSGYGAALGTINLIYSIGAITKTWGAGRFQNAHRSNSDYNYNESVSVNIPEDKAVSISANATASKSYVSAAWQTGGAYTFATYSHNGRYLGEYTQNTRLSDEGRYDITVYTSTKLASDRSLYVDKTPPRFSDGFYDAAGKSVIQYTRDESYVLSYPIRTEYESEINPQATFVRSYWDSSAKKVVTLPAESYTDGGELKQEGRYVITVTDAAGNSASCTVIIDRSPPVLPQTQYSRSSVSASFSASVAESPITAKYTLTTSSGTSEERAYSSGMSLSEPGKYTIVATDSVGNSSSTTMYVDKTAPTLVSPVNASKDSVKATWTFADYESPISATYDFISMGGNRNGVAYGSGSELTQEGKYVITATDAAGNSSSVTLFVDRTAPVITSQSRISKTAVKASFSAAVYESPVTGVYSLLSATGNVEDIAYSPGTSLTAEGRYTVQATDEAGNSSSITLFVDRTPPKLERAFEYGKENGNATFSAAPYESAVSAVYSFIGADGTKSNVGYESGSPLKVDGEYAVTATDEAGNSATVRFVVDGKAPTLLFADGTTGTSAVSRTSSSVSWALERYEAPIDAVYSFISFDENKAPSAKNVSYSSGSVFTAEGTYEFTATDRAGNVTVATVIIDNTPPVLTFAANGIAFERYTNTVFTARGDDALSGVDKIEIYENGNYNQYDYMPRSQNGAYLFRLSDKAGNMTSATVTVYKTETFGNVATIRDGYKVNSWYVVTLPARIFTTDSRDVAGRYSFESYERALEFAVTNERAFRVSAVQGGFMYVSATNESVAQKYDDEATLNVVVEKYAKGYISVRQTSTTNGNDKYYTEPESLTRNSPILPDYLLDLKDMPRYFARSSARWSLPSVSYISEMPYTVTAEYLGDLSEERGKTYTVPNGSTFITALGGEYKQGYYLVTERDEAGNVERYLIYSDAELPTARVHATLGDAEKDFVLDYAYTQNETLYFISLGFESILDNADAFVTLKIEKGSSVKYFTQSDALPTLGADDFTSGKYTVTLFDRSLNALTFDVFIAGAPPTMAHGSLAADKPDCKISFVTSDRYNVITGITLYKIEYDGTKTVLDTDGLGTPISAATLSYTLTVGGKYGATVTDNYRRTVVLDPIFFLKGLPSGKLAGVADGGRTNNNVSFTFDSADVCELFVLLPDGERQAFTDFTVQTGSADKTYNITASELTSHEYLVFLHNAQDLSLFVEYTFEIDTILPEFEITDSDGNVIEPDGATNKSFSISWSETGVNMRYYTAKGGSLSAAKYNMNAVLSQGTLYYFTLKDDVGNTLDFTVLLDNAVDYVIGGKYNEVDGVFYASAPITFTVNEPTQVFDVVNAVGYTIDNGGTLTQEGRYDITVTDNYRNTVTLKIVLDFSPPSIELVGADNGESVKGDVTLSAFDHDYLYLSDSRGNKIKDVTNGEIFSDAGVYYITARDYAGNTATVSFSIDLSVDYTLSVPSGAVTTDKVTLDTAEPLDISVTLNGAPIESTTKFTECGTYELTLTDALGNSVSCVFTIISSKSQTLNVPLPSGTRIISVTRNGEPFELADNNALAFDTTGVYVVTLDCGGTPFELTVETDNTPPAVTLNNDGKTVCITAVDKENVALVLTLDGNEINCRVGQVFDEDGHYVLTVTDELGNVSVYEFDIPFRLNAWAIVAICVGGVVLLVVLVLVIRARRKPRMK